MLLQHVAGAAYAAAAAVSVLGNLVAGSCNNECRAGANVERVLAVTARTNYVKRVFLIQVYVLTGLQQALAQAKKLIYSHSACLYCHKQSGYLLVVVLAVNNVQHDAVCLLLSQCGTVNKF